MHILSGSSNTLIFVPVSLNANELLLRPLSRIELAISKTSVLVLIIMFIALKSCVLNSGGPLSALTCCVNVRLLSGDKKKYRR